MKTLLLSLFVFIQISIALSQSSNLIVFSEQGEKFSIILNGIRQNSQPETNVKITNLTQPNYKLKVIFENTSIADLDKNVMLEPEAEMVLNIKKNNTDVYVLRFVSQAPIASTNTVPQQTVIAYTPTPAPQTISTTTTTTTVGATPVNNVSMGVNANGVGVNVSISDGMTSTTTTSTTTTYTSTTNAPNEPKPNANVYVLPGYNGAIGCSWPMEQNEFTGVKKSISSKSFDDSRLQIAKQVIGSNCLLSSQVKELMLLFSFEDTRLDLAKYAYGYTYDIGNFYKINDAFSFESSIDELNEYIQAKK